MALCFAVLDFRDWYFFSPSKVLLSQAAAGLLTSSFYSMG